jgi:predicted NUDIX family NTP pyrophosphohydrolase
MISMPKVSAGILMYKRVNEKIKVFLVHPGGPLWVEKEEHAWDIPKGEVNSGEELIDAALRELKEETGINLWGRSKADFICLNSANRLDGQKVYHIWAIESDWSGILMGTSYFETEWPPHSGKKMKFAEVDKAGFFDIDSAKMMLYDSLGIFIDRLKEKLVR